MKILKLTALAALLALVGCASNPSASTSATKSAAVDEQTQVDASTSVAQNDDPRADDKLRCKRVKKTGSHRTQLVCTSKADEEDEARRTQDATRRTQIRGQACISCGGDG